MARQPLPTREDLTGHWENTLNYSKTFGIHSLNAVIGQSMQAYKNEFVFTATSDFDDNRLGYNAIQVGKENIDRKLNHVRLAAFIFSGPRELYVCWISTCSQLLPALMDHPSLEQGNRYGLFPSFAVAWQMKEESFLNSVDVISDMKLEGRIWS
jgi:hypothetical protein